MHTASRIGLTLTMVGIAAGTVGCVPQDRYDQLLKVNRSLEEQIVQLEDENTAQQNTIGQLRGQVGGADASVSDLEQRNANLSSDLNRLNQEYDEMLNRVSRLELGPLPIELEREIGDLANQYPDLLTFDPQTGMIRFASDFTFALGSADLSTSAAEGVARLGEILTSSDASGLEVHVIGHTDNVPIGKPETRQKHPTNLHLSVHRAIAVRNALASAGVAPSQIQVAGFGEFRPVVANGPRGAAENRRVEVFLVPLNESATAFTPEAGTGTLATPESAQRQPDFINEPMK